MSNPFNEALDAEDESEEQTTKSNFDVDRYLNALGDGPKDKTIGIAVDEELHAFYQELRDDKNVEIDVAQSIRDHLEKLANRHPKTFEKAMRKLEI